MSSPQEQPAPRKGGSFTNIIQRFFKKGNKESSSQNNLNHDDNTNKQDKKHKDRKTPVPDNNRPPPPTDNKPPNNDIANNPTTTTTTTTATTDNSSLDIISANKPHQQTPPKTSDPIDKPQDPQPSPPHPPAIIIQQPSPSNTPQISPQHSPQQPFRSPQPQSPQSPPPPQPLLQIQQDHGVNGHSVGGDHDEHPDETPITPTQQTEYVPLRFLETPPKLPSQQPPKPRTSGPPEILPEEIEYDPTADFLGQGSFGSVYKGRCRGQEVAVKIPRKQKLTLAELTSFRNEVKIMSKIYHPNVVLFLGACTQMGKMQIVTERCMTDLEKLLASKRPLSLYERMRMAKDAALGMNWLHGITRIVHNDLKSANLLVDNHMRVKVTDFGFSQIKEGDQFVDKSKKGTPLWMAPEVMMGQPYDDKADVYSFGIILWEIVTRDVPYKHHNDYNTFFRAVCHDHERPPLPADIMPSIKYLITACWDHDPNKRPTFNEIVFRISEVMVECMIENESGRQLWKKYFLVPKQELVEQVPWTDFVTCINENLQYKGENQDLLGNVRKLLVTLPRDTVGQVTEVVTMERFDKVIKWFGAFFDPTAGIEVIDEINTLATKGWFHWDITRDESTSRLAMQEEGTFLIRLSSTDPKVTPFTLSLTGNQHRRIKRVPGGYRLQGKQKVYTSLQDLVDNCEDHNLKRPCPKVDTSNPYGIEFN